MNVIAITFRITLLFIICCHKAHRIIHSRFVRHHFTSLTLNCNLYFNKFIIFDMLWKHFFFFFVLCVSTNHNFVSRSRNDFNRPGWNVFIFVIIIIVMFFFFRISKTKTTLFTIFRWNHNNAIVPNERKSLVLRTNLKPEITAIQKK